MSPLKILLVLATFFTLHSPLVASIPILYLSWKGDPSTTMVVQWHTLKDSASPSVVFYQKEGEEAWLCEEGSSKIIEGTRAEVHTVELTALDPDSSYVFRAGNDKEEMLFRTLPRSLKERELKIAIGGDAYFSYGLFRKMSRQIAMKDPDFVVVGGDIAYVHGHTLFFGGRRGRLKRWQTFLREWRKQMIGADGRLIPLIAVIGNHDVDGKEKKDGTFFDLFAFPEEGKAYRMFNVGEDLSLVLLDTGHRARISGEQTEWLEKELKQREATTWKMAAYHVAAYPSVYHYEAKTPHEIRTSWCPLFDTYGVTAAFEHHNHAFKRSFPLKGDKIDPEGMLYLGDGAWGVSPRKTTSKKKTWYLEKVKKTNCCWLATLTAEGCVFEAFNNKGVLLDSVSVERPAVNVIAAEK